MPEATHPETWSPEVRVARELGNLILAASRYAQRVLDYCDRPAASWAPTWGDVQQAEQDCITAYGHFLSAGTRAAMDARPHKAETP